MDRNEAINSLTEEWYSSGVEKDDLLLVHSSSSRILRSVRKLNPDVGPEDIVESFLNAVGEGGTVLFPTFNFDFTKGVAFDIDKTPSHMGVITESARKHPRAVRTGHPVYSFSVIGKEAESYRGLENYSGYGNDSPFSMIHSKGGKIAVLDLPDQNSMTFYHYVEESLNVDYRYLKEFISLYKGVDGKEEERRFAIYVRNLEKGVKTHVDPMGEVLWNKGMYLGCRPKEGNGLRVINSKDLYEEVSKVIEKGEAEGLLYKIEE